ncbi:hypothetical protein JXD38_12675 [candidate division WOR-3 bacterium]|nr:hypothetical protein [candidate division WOR-3 bacterium]
MSSSWRVLAVLALAAAMLPLPSCDGVPDPVSFTYGDSTRLPENEAGLRDVIVEDDTLTGSDTLRLVFASGGTKPTYRPGEILFGAMGGGYMKKVVSSSVRGDTVVVVTEQSDLTEVFDRLQIDTSFSLAPAQLVPPESTWIRGEYEGTDIKYKYELSFGTPSLSNPDDRTAVVTIPDLKFVVKESDDTLVVVASIKTSEVVMTIRTDGSAFVDIDEIFPFYHGFDISFDMYDTLEFRDLEISLGVPLPLKETKINLCRIVQPFMLGPVPMTFNTDISAGVILSVAARSAVTCQLKAGFDLEMTAHHTPDMALPSGSLGINFGCTGEVSGISGQVSAELKEFIRGEASVMLAGVLGPFLSFGPYQYNRFSVPPPTLDVGVGVSGKFGVKLDAFGLFDISASWEFLDANWRLFYMRQVFAENFDLCNLGPGVSGGPNSWEDSVKSPSWLGVVTDGMNGTRCLLLADTSVSSGNDYDSSFAWAAVATDEYHDHVGFQFSSDDASFDMGIRSLGNVNDPASCSWYLNLYAGQLHYNDGDMHAVASVAADTWHYVSLSIDWEAEDYDIYLDGRKVKDNAPFRGTNPQHGLLQVVDYDSSYLPTPGIRFDGLSATSYAADDKLAGVSPVARPTFIRGAGAAPAWR